jgi:dihydroorotase-like cyclic amidohydrolase
LTRDSPIGCVGKVNPPLRSQADVNELWEGVRSGEIETIGSDHVSRKLSTKGDDLWSASAGFPGIATLLPVLIEEGWHKRRIPIEILAATTSSNVAKLYSVPNKGWISVGFDADFTIVDPGKKLKVDPAVLESYSDYSPYAGMDFRGAAVATILRGRVIAQAGAVAPGVRENPQGRYMFREG